jgi:hypothetical protein
VSFNTSSGQPPPTKSQLLPPGMQLASQLREGWIPPAISVPFRLDPPEACVGVTNGNIEQWLPGGDGTYTHRSVAFGGIGGFLVGGALSAMMNSGSRAKAARNLAERWIAIEQARIYVTTKRIAIEGRNNWWELWYSDVRKIQYDLHGVILHLSGVPPYRLPLRPSDYWLVMLVHFVEGKVVDAPPATV